MIIVGLGNPGRRYEGTRHNVGRDVVADLARRHGVSMERSRRFQGYVGDGRVAQGRCYFLLPETFMNRSGESVGPFLRFHKGPPEDLLVVHDELDLPVGTLRLKKAGGHGGHNGLRDIERVLGSRDFARLRVGIDRPPPRMDPANYVLTGFAPEQLIIMKETKHRALGVVEEVLQEGIQQVMNQVNRRPRASETEEIE